MSFNGSGSFLINTAGQPVVSGTVISSTAFNALTADLATGLSTCITKDGQTTVTANIPMANYKFTGLGAGSAAADSANLSQVQSTVVKLLASVSGTDTITAVGSPTVAAYAAGQMFYFVAAGDNTGAVTINIDSLGAKNVTRDGSVALAAGDIKSGEVVVIVYDGTRFQVVSQLNSSGDARFANVSIASALNVGGVATVTGGSVLNGGVVINEPGADVDFRVEGDTDANLLFTDASTDRVGVGTNTPGYKLDVNFGGGSQAAARISGNDQANVRLRLENSGSGGRTWEICGGLPGANNANLSIRDVTGSTTPLTLDASGNLGVGTTSPSYKLQVSGTQNNNDIVITNTTTSSSLRMQSIDAYGAVFVTGNYPLMLGTNDTERARITSDGNLLVGTTTNAAKLTVDGNIQTIWGQRRIATNFDNNFRQGMYFDVTARNLYLFSTSNDGGGNILFSTRNANGSSDSDYGTERARITSGGDFLVAKTSSTGGGVGIELRASGLGYFGRSAANPLDVNRTTDDGNLVNFYQADTLEGNISVSGNTVSYNAFAGSHWSQLQDGSKPDILRGTVMESINELCVWPGEQNERLPKAKVSDTAGSKKVYGVFMAWDNDWTTTNDMYVTAVGAFICRVNGSVTVQEGDLLESNGDGTARVQADDIIRSSTIGKVTSTVKTHQYADGSYCVPTVLYCG